MAAAGDSQRTGSLFTVLLSDWLASLKGTCVTEIALPCDGALIRKILSIACKIANYLCWFSAGKNMFFLFIDTKTGFHFLAG